MKDEKTNLVELIILLLLLEGKKSGIDLNAEYKLKVGKEIGTSIYVLLGRMAAKGFTVCESTNTYPYKGYEITDKGRKIFNKYHKIISLERDVNLNK